MLLIKETIDKYGYDPTTLTKGSHKNILFSCPQCGEINEIRIRYFTGDDYKCKRCTGNTGQTKKEKIEYWKKTTNEFNNENTLLPNILNQETYDKYGYYAHEVKQGSHRPVLYRCADCGTIKETRIRYIKSENHICSDCSNKIKAHNHNKEFKAKGLAPNGLVLGFHDEDKYRKTKCEWRKKWRSTPTGQAINRLRVSLKRLDKGYSTKNLPYTALEFANHIQERINARNNECPLCEKSFDDVGYNIDHKIPLCTANTPEEALELFSLYNLDVMCPECNQFVKGDKEMDY